MNQLISLESFVMQPSGDKILALNSITEEHGLVLTPEEAAELSETRAHALRDNDRLEIGLGAVEGIIRRFSKSSFVDSSNYAHVLHEITELFYYIKTETDDKISDNALLDELYVRFEKRCRGSVETLQNREAWILIRKVNAGENYGRWYGETDDVDSSRDAGENARRAVSGEVTPYLTNEYGEAVEIENYYREEKDNG